MNWIASEDYLALMFEVSDEQLKRIEADRNYYNDTAFVRSLHDEKGDNAHIYGLEIRNGKPDIRWFVRELLKKYKSVSWWTVGHRKFFLRRRA